jgi:hypothetical protein
LRIFVGEIEWRPSEDERAFTFQGALRHVEIVWPPAAETSDTNATHGENASAAPSQQAVRARSANEL